MRRFYGLAVHQEAIADGHVSPLAPAWCAPDALALERALATLRFGLTIRQ